MGAVANTQSDQRLPGALERVRRLAAYVKRLDDTHKAALESRDSAILDANDAGHSYAEIARVAGMSGVHALRIVTNRAAERGAKGDPCPSDS